MFYQGFLHVNQVEVNVLDKYKRTISLWKKVIKRSYSVSGLLLEVIFSLRKIFIHLCFVDHSENSRVQRLRI